MQGARAIHYQRMDNPLLCRILVDVPRELRDIEITQKCPDVQSIDWQDVFGFRDLLAAPMLLPHWRYFIRAPHRPSHQI